MKMNECELLCVNPAVMASLYFSIRLSPPPPKCPLPACKTGFLFDRGSPCPLKGFLCPQREFYHLKCTITTSCSNVVEGFPNE